ncbi:hypothetical protein BX600DRAFT_508461 [Xylariales sp. PMI_506]|nr:hypothetical protein BX600DRAFT_508461 [Xylariales sp. PMI_506]
MPSKIFLLERASRDYICRSCLLSLQRRPISAPLRWGIRPSSHSSTQAPAAPRGHAQTAQDDERTRTLKKLGLLKESGEEDRVKVNYFEEADGGKLKRLEGEQQFANSVVDIGGEISKTLEELEIEYGQATKFMEALGRDDEPDGLKKLEELEKLNVGIHGASKLADLLRPAGGSEEINKLREKLNETFDTGSRSFSPYQTSALEEPFGRIYVEITTQDWPRWNHVERIKSLNTHLQLAAGQLDRGKVDGKGFELWKWYSAARRALSSRPDVVPQAAWQVLWDVFSTESLKNPNRMAHVSLLARDMIKAGVTLSDRQQLQAIEAMFIEGWHDEAIENHKRRVTTLGTQPETFIEFWEIGLRMYCHVGDLERAERLGELILESSYRKDPRILFPLIRLYANKPETVEKAYDLYRRFRAEVQEVLTLEDYDQIISYFLVANQTEVALWIFTEMMTSGRVDLRRLKKLPPSVANEFFVGKWLKRLIGAGDYNGAYNVLLHMKKRGVMPRPIQVNGLIGAWLRSETAENLEKAEATAWAMINSRLQFVDRRSYPAENLDARVSFEQGGDGWPKATLETFSLLAENYKNRGLHQKMEELWEAFSQAEMGPNSFLMNQLLFSLHRIGRGQEVASLYRKFVEKYRLEPDSWTFTVLWETLPINRLQRLKSQDVPTEMAKTRNLFADMVRYAPALKKDEFDHGLARLIMHSFRHLKDPIGMLVAYRALRQIFNLTQPGSMVLELVAGTSNLVQASGNPRMRNKIITGTQRIDHYLGHRQAEMVAAGELKKGEQLSNDAKSKEMANFLEIYLETEISNMENVEALFMEAATEMGVYSPEPTES